MIGKLKRQGDLHSPSWLPASACLFYCMTEPPIARIAPLIVFAGSLVTQPSPSASYTWLPARSPYYRCCQEIARGVAVETNGFRFGITPTPGQVVHRPSLLDWC